MVRRHLLRLSLAVTGGTAACSSGDSNDTHRRDVPDVEFTAEQTLQLRTMWPLPAVPDSPTNAHADDPWAAQLGHYLFFDAGLSRDGDLSCASCHIPDQGWSDGLRLGEGVETVDRHTMSLYNSGHSRWAYWDGRCDTLWCQAIEPIEDPRELANSRVGLVHHLRNDAALSQAYRVTFGPLPDTTNWPAHGRPVPGDDSHADQLAWNALNSSEQAAANEVLVNVAKSIAAFERTLVSRNSAFDRFAEALLVDGDEANGHLSQSAQRGLELFIGKGRCHFCHAGPGFTNQEFANVGLADRTWLQPADRGRVQGIVQLRDNPFRGDGLHSDDPATGAVKLQHLTTTGEQEGQFKVPSLRSVALSPPYMHGGHFDTLEEAVRHYGEVVEFPELGHREDLLQDLELSDEEVIDLVAFLESLTGEPLPEELTHQPESPLVSSQ